MNFTESDKKQIQEKGISIQKIANQIDHLKKGFPFLDIIKPANIGDGLIRLSENEIVELIEISKRNYPKKKIIKFVPASGAATRMFKHLYDFNSSQDNAEILMDKSFNSPAHFFSNLNSFAFINDLREIAGLQSDEPFEDYRAIFNSLITDKGLNYGNLPKGLLKFHSYPEGSKTPVQEHLVEGALYAASAGKVYMHLTVSEEHMTLFKKHIENSILEIENKYGLKFEVSFSVQKSSTDSMAVTLENEPFRADDGSLLFRPGGHGALIENLNELDADIIFIKNIDNVVPDRLKDETVKYKLALAGILLQTQERIFNYYEKLGKGVNISNKLIVKVEEFFNHVLCVVFPDEYAKYKMEEKVEYLRNKLNRPLRVCGMVKNAGEPGGGPFWATNPDGSVSLQVVESSQIDLKNNQKKSIVNQSTHFNPVDLVCAVKDPKGKKYDLLNFVDNETGFISHKSKDGKELKAIELPGLWNGAMSNWNTLFVEVPLITFNPVKTVNDLLRPEHQ